MTEVNLGNSPGYDDPERAEVLAYAVKNDIDEAVALGRAACRFEEGGDIYATHESMRTQLLYLAQQHYRLEQSGGFSKYAYAPDKTRALEDSIVKNIFKMSNYLANEDGRYGPYEGIQPSWISSDFLEMVIKDIDEDFRDRGAWRRREAAKLYTKASETETIAGFFYDHPDQIPFYADCVTIQLDPDQPAVYQSGNLARELWLRGNNNLKQLEEFTMAESLLENLRDMVVSDKLHTEETGLQKMDALGFIKDTVKYKIRETRRAVDTPAARLLRAVRTKTLDEIIDATKQEATEI